MKTKENIHAGHRERLRKSLETYGIENTSDLHFLEYILTLVIPRADTNPIAHALLKEFQTIDNVFEAPIEALLLVDGVGPKTAKFLNTMLSVTYVYNKSKALKKPYVGTLADAVEFLRKIFPVNQNEQLIVLNVSKSLEIKNYKMFKGISHSSVNVCTNELTEFLVKNKSNFCIIAHTHPDNSATPSVLDDKTFVGIKDMLSTLSIKLVDNLIIGKDNYYSYKINQVHNYTDLVNIEYKKFLNTK